VYRIDLIEYKPRFKRRKKRIVDIRLIRYFYVFLSYKRFKQIGKVAKLKSGLYEHNYLLALEGRMVNLLYRTGIVDTLFRSFNVVKGGFLAINGKVCFEPNTCVNIFDLVTFSPQIIYSLFLEYFTKIYQFNILHTPMRCIYFSVIFFFFFY